MKNALSILLLLLFTGVMYAQEGINYKALIKDNLGVVVASQDIDVRFTIISDTGPADVYEETHEGATTDANGIVILTIGSVTPPTLGVFAAIDWGSDTHSLKVDIDIEQDGSFVDLGTTQFMAVPYAKAATTAKELTGGIDQAYIAALEARIAALEPPPPVIGDLIAGGVVFWVDPANPTHGLVCTLSDYPATSEWGCFIDDLPNVPNVTNNPPSGDGAEIGDGMSNTNNILNDCPTSEAALDARSYGTEWFLPSTKELNEMYENKSELEDVAGFSAFSNYYWSSTENDFNMAWGHNFTFDIQSPSLKGIANSVRAVRAY